LVLPREAPAAFLVAPVYLAIQFLDGFFQLTTSHEISLENSHDQSSYDGGCRTHCGDDCPVQFGVSAAVRLHSYQLLPLNSKRIVRLFPVAGDTQAPASLYPAANVT